MNIENIIYQIAVWAIPVLFAITLHEVAHGWVANKLGDGTAKMLGRLTLNPLKHIDLMGTIILPIVTLLLINFPFGWAKPIPVNTRNFKKPSKDMAKVALAGPLANLLMALMWVLMIKVILTFSYGSNVSHGLVEMAYAGIKINILLFIFNLLPIPPLDGGRVLAGFVPPRISDVLDKIEPYGIFIVLGVIYFGIIDLSPLLQYFHDLSKSIIF